MPAATHPTAVTAHAVLAAGVPAIGACLGLWGDRGSAAVVHDGRAAVTGWAQRFSLRLLHGAVALQKVM